MAAATERLRAFFDAESAGIFVTNYKITVQNYTDWIFSTIWKEDYDIANGVPQLNSSGLLDVSKFYPGSAPVDKSIIEYDSTLGFFKVVSPANSGSLGITVDLSGIDQTNNMIETGDAYNIGWKEHATQTGFYSPFSKSRYFVKSASYTSTLANAGATFIHTSTSTHTLPPIDNTLAGISYIIVSASGITTVSASSGNTFPAYVPTSGRGVDELGVNAGQFVLTSGRTIILSMPSSGSVWNVIYKGDWYTPLSQTLSVTPVGTTLTIDASRHVGFITSTLADGNYTLVINNMKDTQVLTIAKLSTTSAGKILTWPGTNTYFSGNVANAAAIVWTTHDLITIEKKGANYYIDVVEQSSI